MSCKACNDPRSADVEKQIWLGNIQMSDACKMFDMTYEEYWNHLKNHVVTEPNGEKVDTSDLGSVLRYLIKRLKNRVDTLLATPPNTLTEKGVSQQARLLKDIVMDLAKLEHQIQESPTVQIQNFIVQQTELTTFLLSNLCGNCRQKVMEYLQVERT